MPQAFHRMSPVITLNPIASSLPRAPSQRLPARACSCCGSSMAHAHAPAARWWPTGPAYCPCVGRPRVARWWPKGLTGFPSFGRQPLVAQSWPMAPTALLAAERLRHACAAWLVHISQRCCRAPHMEHSLHACLYKQLHNCDGGAAPGTYYACRAASPQLRQCRCRHKAGSLLSCCEPWTWPCPW